MGIVKIMKGYNAHLYYLTVVSLDFFILKIEVYLNNLQNFLILKIHVSFVPQNKAY